MQEYLDIVDEKGRPTGEIVAREVAHSQGIWHHTAHVWLVRYHKGKLQVLLQKRSLDKDSFPGCYDISSAGHIPAGVDYLPSALRELEEELGLKVKAEQLVFCGDRKIVYDGSFHGRPYHDRQYSRVFLLWCDCDESSFIVQTEEIESVRWFDFAECLERTEKNTFQHCLEMEELLLVKKTAEFNDKI